MMNFRKATTDDCDLINSVAARIWAPTYSHLMSPEQLAYMFDMMYAPENLRKAMTVGGQTFLIFYGDDTCNERGVRNAEIEIGKDGGMCEYDSDGMNGEPVGYISYETLPDHDFYLQKIYLLPSEHGRGAGRQMLELFLEYLRELDPSARRLGLNVNRENQKAIDFYHRNGFEIVSRRDHHIGQGYYMNDYILERDI